MEKTLSSFYGVTANRPRSFNPSYVSSGGGALRIFTIVVGIVAIILASVGSPSDLNSKNSGTSELCDNYYGYGTGYDREPLNIAFIVTLTVVWLVSLCFLLALGFEMSHECAVKANRFFHLTCGLLLLGAVACGCAGTAYFWQGCCRLRLFGEPLQKGLSHEGYNTWCRCTITSSSPENNQRDTKDIFTSQSRDTLSGKTIFSAWPHHFTTHCGSLVLAFVDGLLYLLAVCIV